VARVRFELVEDTGVDPLVAPVTDRGRRAGAVAGLAVAGPEHQYFNELVEHDPVVDAGAVAPQRVNHDAFGEKGRELGPQRLGKTGWQSRHERLLETAD